MFVQPINGEGVTSYDVVGLTPREMHELQDMDDKITHVLVSHHPKYKGKKEYLSDDDLHKLRGILYALVGNVHDTAVSTFKKCEDELRDMYNRLEPDDPE